MALKDRLTDALNATTPENSRRAEILRTVLTAGGATDSGLAAAIANVIADCEQRAASYNTAGQTDLAKAEHDEIDLLRGFLRLTEPPSPATPKKPKAAAEAASANKEPLFTNMQKIIGGVVVVALVAAVGIWRFGFASDSGNEMLSSAPSTKISVLKDDRTLGSPGAPITLLEYAAPACPHCAHFSLKEFPELKEKYVDTGKVFYIFRVFPIMPADGAAEAIARCLPADKYFYFLDLLFRNQPIWDPEYRVTDVRGGLIQVAKRAGLSATQVDTCISNKDEQYRINAVAQDGQLKYNINSTPTFIVNGDVIEVPVGETQGSVLKAKFESLLSKH